MEEEAFPNCTVLGVCRWEGRTVGEAEAGESNLPQQTTANDVQGFAGLTKDLWRLGQLGSL